METSSRINYKPLEMCPAQADRHLENDIDCGLIDQNLFLDDDDEDNSYLSRPQSPIKQRQHNHSRAGGFSSHGLNLKQLRVLLYLVAVILFLLFIAQLSTNDRGSSTQLLSNPSAVGTTNTSTTTTSDPKRLNITIAQEQTPSRPSFKPNSNILARLDDRRPQYDTYISSVLKENSLKETQNVDEDDLHFSPNDNINNLPSSSRNSIWWLLNMRDNNKYVTVTNYIRAMKSFNYNSSITLTTQATTEFMYHTLELCKRWEGPISVAVFGPGLEMLVVTTLIKFMRHCLPSPLNACIKDKVTWHLVYNKKHGPPPSALSYPKYHLDNVNFPLFVNQDQCPKLIGPEPVDTIKQFEEMIRKKNGILTKSYRQQFQLPYPINVLRNTARLAAGTKFVLASDIELYPSINLVPSFINYIKNHNVKLEFNNVEKFDFTLPIFEIKSNVTAPKTKPELIKLIQNGDAVFFHKWVCDECQNYPNRLDWLQTDKLGLENYQASSDEISIFEVTQRDNSKKFWEPIFIGTNDDPLYDDRLTWDGRRDKMGQMYEMCLQGYHHFILGNAFLVHAPGIKHIDRNDTIRRLNYIRQNNAIFDETIAKLKQQYSNSNNIYKC